MTSGHQIRTRNENLKRTSAQGLGRTCTMRKWRINSKYGTLKSSTAQGIRTEPLYISVTTSCSSRSCFGSFLCKLDTMHYSWTADRVFSFKRKRRQDQYLQNVISIERNATLILRDTQFLSWRVIDDFASCSTLVSGSQPKSMRRIRVFKSDKWHIPRYPTRKHCITTLSHAQVFGKFTGISENFGNASNTLLRNFYKNKDL